MNPPKPRTISALFILGGIMALVLTLGFFFQLSWATDLWPWPDGRLSYIFISSITAAIAVPMIWIGLSGEFGAAKGGAINLGVAAIGSSIYFFLIYLRDRELQFLVTAVISTFFVLINALIYSWSKKIPIQDNRSMPLLVKISFVLFSIILLLVGTLLVLQRPTLFPWPLKPESSVIFGSIFLGASLYFASSLTIPKWHNAKGQLLGFLAYDLVLIGPFLAHFNTVKDEHRLSLVIYTSILLYSGALAIYYLFLSRSTRSWKIQEDLAGPVDLRGAEAVSHSQ